MSEEKNTTNNDKSDNPVIPQSATNEYVFESTSDITNPLNNTGNNEEINKEGGDNQKGNRVAIKANRIAFAAMTVSAIVGFFTILLFWQTKEAVSVAKRANEISDSSRKSNEIVSKENLMLAQNMFKEQKESSENSDKMNKKFYSTAEKSASIAEKALLENKKNYEFSRRSVINQNRSYIVINKLDIERDTIGTLINTIIEVKNIGATQAYNVTINYYALWGETESRIIIKPLENNFFTSPINYIGGGQSITFPIQIGNELGIHGIEPGYIDLFVIVRIQYTDVYDVKHSTNTFQRYNRVVNKFIYCRKYNDAN